MRSRDLKPARWNPPPPFDSKHTSAGCESFHQFGFTTHHASVFSFWVYPEGSKGLYSIPYVKKTKLNNEMVS